MKNLDEVNSRPSSRIGKVKFKSGGELTLLHYTHKPYVHIDLKYGEVIIRNYDNRHMTQAEAYYMLDQAKLKLFK